MKEIQMVDLKGQHQRIKSELDPAINQVLDTTAFIRGPQVKSFTDNLEKFLGIRHVIGCANGTDALQLALMALSLPEGSEVITSDFTFVATAEVIRLLGFKPVLVDVDLHTFNILPEEIEKAITPKTKAIIPVHIFGQCCDMESIMAIAKKHDLYVIEDTAQAIGADYTFGDGTKRKAGTIGDIGCTSFFPSKNLGAMGDGGAIFTNDDELAKKIASIANHGQADQYYYNYIGINSRLDTLQAAALDVKLRYLNDFNERRKSAATYYDQAFGQISDLETPVRDEKSTHIFHQYTLKVKGGKRDALMKHLQDSGIPSKVYYPVPLHIQKPYANGRVNPNSLSLSMEVLSLPMHTELEKDQLEHISTTVKKFFE